jgi:hypothetical protein
MNSLEHLEQVDEVEYKDERGGGLGDKVIELVGSSIQKFS